MVAKSECGVDGMTRCWVDVEKMVDRGLRMNLHSVPMCMTRARFVARRRVRRRRLLGNRLEGGNTDSEWH